MLIHPPHKDGNGFLWVSIMKCCTNSLYHALPQHGYHHVPGAKYHQVPLRRMAHVHWSVVRNPYDRAVSIWASAALREMARDKYGFCKIIRANGGDPESFDDFASCFLAVKDRPSDHICNPGLWSNQSDWLDLYICDEVLHYETLESDLMVLHGERIVLPRLNVSTHTHWTDYYMKSKETRAIVTAWAGEDFDRYRYSKFTG